MSKASRLTDQNLLNSVQPPESPSQPKPWPFWLQIAVFSLVFFALQGGWSYARGTAVEHIAVDMATVKPAAWLLNTLSPDLMVEAVGARLRAPGGGINILNGCEGFEIAFLLIAALVIMPMTARHRLMGLLLGIPFVWSLNQIRIIGLFLANRADKELFALLHGTVAPLLLVVIVAVAFVWFTAALKPIRTLPTQQGNSNGI